MFINDNICANSNSGNIVYNDSIKNYVQLYSFTTFTIHFTGKYNVICVGKYGAGGVGVNILR